MRQIRKTTGILFGALALFALDQPAKASNISYNYTGAFDLLTPATQNFSVQGFDPTLGSLTAIDFTFTFHTLHTFAGTDGIDFFIIGDATAPLDGLSFQTPGGETTTQSGQFGVPASHFGDYESAQLITLFGAPHVRCSNCLVYNATLSGQVNYTYTPAVTPTPEAATFVLAGASLLGLGALRRIRRE